MYILVRYFLLICVLEYVSSENKCLILLLFSGPNAPLGIAIFLLFLAYLILLILANLLRDLVCHFVCPNWPFIFLFVSDTDLDHITVSHPQEICLLFFFSEYFFTKIRIIILREMAQQRWLRAGQSSFLKLKLKKKEKSKIAQRKYWE